MQDKDGELFSQIGGLGFVTATDVAALRTRQIGNVDGILPFIVFLIYLSVKNLLETERPTKPLPLDVSV